MWDDVVQRLLVLELVQTGRTQMRRSQAAAWQWLVDLPWTQDTNRRGERVLVGDGLTQLLELLDRVWPDWRDAVARLEQHHLSPTPDGWRALLDAERAASVPSLPVRLNRRTAASVVAPHAKAVLTPTRLAALGDTVVTHDGVIRLRPPAGLVLVRDDASIACDDLVAVLGEIALPERALTDGTTLQGDVRGIVLVENLGPFQDLEPVDGALVAYVPGWDTYTIRLLLQRMAPVPVVLFGDLDPNGIRIAEHLRGARPDLRWAVPDFWREYLDRALDGDWPPELNLDSAPSLVRELAERSLWIEQEAVVLDPRLAPYLSELLASEA